MSLSKFYANIFAKKISHSMTFIKDFSYPKKKAKHHLAYIKTHSKLLQILAVTFNFCLLRHCLTSFRQQKATKRKRLFGIFILLEILFWNNEKQK